MDNDNSEYARLWRLFVCTGTIRAESREVDRLINVARVDPNMLHATTAQNFLQLLCADGHLVPQQGVVSMFDIFLRSPNFNVNHVDNFGFALIHYCVQMEDPIFLRMLLEMRRRDINIDVQIDGSVPDGHGHAERLVKNVTGCTAMNLLFEQTIIPLQEKLQLLLDNGANPNIVDHEGFGPIHNLIRNADSYTKHEIVNNIHALLASPPMLNHDNNNADPNLRVQGGFTPLHIALTNRCQKYVFDALLKDGADVSLRDNAGRTPLEYARTFTVRVVNPPILDLLWKNSPEFRAMRLHAERVLWRPTHGNSEIYQRILEEGGMHPPRHPQ
jgi:ankyrin repeat protein